MVLPIIAAGARVAATTTARAGATVARAGASATKTAARGTSSAVRKGIDSSGRNIVRTRRNATPSASSGRFSSRSSGSNTTRTRNSARGEETQLNGRASYFDEEEEYQGQNSVSSNQSTKPRIGNLIALILLFVAALLDVLELGLDIVGTFGVIVGVLIGLFKDAMTVVFFPVVFWILGAPFWKGKHARKKMAAMISGFVIALIPWVGAFMPETLLSVFITIYYTRAEDKQNDPVKSMQNDIVRAKRLANKANRLASRFRR